MNESMSGSSAAAAASSRFSTGAAGYLRRALSRESWSLRKPFRRGLNRAFHSLPRFAREHILWLLYERNIGLRPDRQYLERDIIGFLAGIGARDVLFVGCRAYTSHYPRLFEERGMALFTCDVDPTSEPFGSPGRHHTVDVCQLSPDVFDVRFDAIVFSGVIGFGVDTVAQVEKAAVALASLLAPGDVLIQGSNTDRGVDPLTNPVWQALFKRTEKAGMSKRVLFPGSTHYFDVLERS